MAVNHTAALPSVANHHHGSGHHLHEGQMASHHHPHHNSHSVVSHLHTEVSFDEFTNSMSPFIDYSPSLHIPSSPYAAVTAAAAVAAASGGGIEFQLLKNSFLNVRIFC